MKTQRLCITLLSALVFGISCSTNARDSGASRIEAKDDFHPETIITLERGALDRWGKGDPQGYLEIMAPEVTYFDPFQEKRLDGLDAMKAFVTPLTGQIKVDRFEMIGPKVQRDGNVALLTFNLISYLKQADGSEKAVARWNSTETYRLIDGQWKIIHSHWSYIKPELKQPSPVA